MTTKAKHIFRAPVRKDFVIINRTCLKDDRVSLKAKGLHCLMLAQADEWEFYLDDLVKRSRDGRDSVKAAIKELYHLGYLNKYAERDKKGKIVRWVTDVYEYPQALLTTCQKPVDTRALSRSGKSTSGKPTCGKSTPNKNNNNNINLNKNNNVISEQSQTVILKNEVSVITQSKVKPRLGMLVTSGYLAKDDSDRLYSEVLCHISNRPSGMTEEHALNAAIKLIKSGKWSTPRVMMGKGVSKARDAVGAIKVQKSEIVKENERRRELESQLAMLLFKQSGENIDGKGSNEAAL